MSEAHPKPPTRQRTQPRLSERSSAGPRGSNTSDVAEPEQAVPELSQMHALVPSAELSRLLGVADDEPMEAMDVITTLLEAGHLAPPTPRLCASSGNVTPRERWRRSLGPAVEIRAGDPWAIHELHKLPTELCVRWDYVASKNEWKRSETLIKLGTEPFARGAMRECFRMKKMSQVNAQYFFNMDWERCNNYVAKRYIKRETDKEVYFSDIKMQMVAKRHSKLFNARGPPKGVDFLQAFVIELRRDGVLQHFCVESYVAGEYVKHNNNSGARDFDGPARATPHAFSRFSFHESAGKLMIVDIQGAPVQRAQARWWLWAYPSPH